MNKEMLEEILANYNLPALEVKLLRHNENKTFRLGEDYLLQIHELIDGFHTEYIYNGVDRMEVHKAELKFLQHLNEQGVSIRESIKNQSGETITKLNNGTALTISKWIEGESLNNLEMDDKLCYQIGELTAHLHKCAEGFRVEPSICYDAGHCQCSIERLQTLESMGLDMVSSKLMQKACEKVGEILENFRKDFLLLHADLSPSNILQTPNGLVAIDFSLFGFGHPMLDIALLFGNISGLACRQKIAEGYRDAGGKIDYKALDACFVLTIIDCIIIHYEKWRKEDWFEARMARWCKESFEPFIRGERLFADDFYLIHVK